MWTAEVERGRASREPRERAEAGALAVIVGPEDGQTKGGRASVRYNEQRSLRTGHWRDRRRGGRTRQNLCSCRYSIRSLARSPLIRP